MSRKRCVECQHARQVGSFKREDVIACELARKGEVVASDIKTEILDEGWMYPYRSPGETGLYEYLEQAYIEWSLWISVDARCKKFAKKRNKQ